MHLSKERFSTKIYIETAANSDAIYTIEQHIGLIGF